MATFTQAQAFFGLEATAAPEKSGTRALGPVGTTSTTIRHGDDVPIYSIEGAFASAGVSITLNPLTGVVSGTSAGTAQVVTLTVVNSAVATGATACSFFAEDVDTGAVSFNVTNGDSPSVIGGKIRTAFVEALAEYEGKWTLGGSGANVTFTRDRNAANDLTALITLEDHPSTAEELSTITTAGAAAKTVAANEGDGKDAEGITLATSSDNPGFLLTVTAGQIKVTDGADFCVKIRAVSESQAGAALLLSDALEFDGNLTISCEEAPDGEDAEYLIQSLLTPT